MLKKILTIISILLLAVNVCAYAAQTNEDYERLLHLGVIDDSYERYANKKTISEKEFLNALVRMITDDKLEDDSVAEYAKARGIISTINNIELNSAISYERALNLSLNALGYAKIIEINGNNNDAIIRLSAESKISKGITLLPGDNLSGSMFLKLLANTMEAKMISVNTGKNGNGGYAINNDDLLSGYRDITKITGRVTQVSDTSLLSEDGCGKNKIAVDEVVYTIGYEYPDELLGQTVYAYVKDSDTGLTAYYIEPKNSEITREEIDGKYILSVAPDFSKITYENGEKTSHITLNPALTVIYNGQNYTGYTVSDLQPKCGKLVCLDFDNDNKYDIVYVYSYETILVKNVSEVYRTITSVYRTGITIFDFSDTSVDVRIYSDGEKASFSSILANSVLSIAWTKGAHKIYKIYVSKETVNGEFSALDMSEKTLKIGEDEYRINATYLESMEADGSIDSISMGSTYTCYLDVFGNIAYIELDAKDGYEYAFLLRQRWNRQEDTAKVRLLNSEGDWEDVFYSKKVKLNAENRQDAIDVYTSLGEDTIEPQLIMIKRDADGRIKAIKTATVSTKYRPNDFTTPSATEFERMYRSQDSSFHCRHYVKYDAAIFIRPINDSDKYNEDKYAVVTSGFFRSDTTYQYKVYNVDEFGYPDAFVVRRNTPGSSVTIFVNKTLTMMNSEDEVVRAVVGNVAGLENMTIQISPDFTEPIAPGDVIEVELRNTIIEGWNEDAPTKKHSVGEVTAYPRTYTYPDDNKDKTHANYVYFKGIIEAVDIERRMVVLYCGTEKIPVYIRDSADINVYNNDTNKYELRNFTDVTPGGYVVIRMDGNNVQWMAVFR